MKADRIDTQDRWFPILSPNCCSPVRLFYSKLDWWALTPRREQERWRYAGFNLVLADPSGAWLLSNRDEAGVTRLPNGLYGVSNATLDKPWAKVSRAEQHYMPKNTVICTIIQQQFRGVCVFCVAQAAQLHK